MGLPLPSTPLVAITGLRGPRGFKRFSRWVLLLLLAAFVLPACGDDDDSSGDDDSSPIGDDDVSQTPGTPTAVPGDSDGDGVKDSLDCAPADPNVYPGAEELCDQLDNNCNSIADDGLLTITWYEDKDDDGYGVDNRSISSCKQPDGFAEEKGDCADTDPDINPGADEVCNGVDDNCDDVADEGLETPSWYLDQDEDGYGSSTQSVKGCKAPLGYVAEGGDCNDGDASIHPMAAESCNGKDDDCDTTIDEGMTQDWYYDADKDGYGSPTSKVTACSQPVGYVAQSGDCNDGDTSIHPGAQDICDSKDNDCDGVIDPTQKWYADNDKDGYGSTASATTTCNPPQGWVTVGGDCNDNDSSMNPGAAELCDSKDNDCDSLVDDNAITTWYYDADADGYGTASSVTTACPKPVGYVASSGDCDDNDKTISPAATETCDGKDNDCDSSVDEGVGTISYYQDLDKDGYGNPAISVSGCQVPNGYVGNGNDCDDSTASINPSATETCDSLDNDCDGQVDEGLSRTFFRDADRDGYGTDTDTRKGCTTSGSYVYARGDCNDSDKLVYPGATDAALDGKDQDCGTTNGPDPHVGLSASSYPTIQAALYAAVPGQTIWVGPGAYFEYEVSFDGKGVTLASTNMAESTLIDAYGVAGVMRFVTYETSTSVLDGFTLTNGNVGVDGYTNGGAGIYIYAASPVVKNCVISNNKAGTDDGGGILVVGGSLTISDSVITGNSASTGGGITVDAGTLLMSGCTVSNNLANAGTSAYGGGIALLDTYEANTIDGTLVEGNSAMTAGGGLDLLNAYADITFTTVVRNSAKYGGGAQIYNSDPSISNCTFSTNLATDSTGGGLNVAKGSSPIISHCLLSGNSAKTQGGGLFVSGTSPATLLNTLLTGNQAGSGGGGIGISSSGPNISFCAITGNTAPVGGGLWLTSASSAPTITGVILAYNSGYDLYNEPASPGYPSVVYSDLYAAFGGGAHNLTSISATNIYAEPKFVAYGGNGLPSDHHLSSTSPCIGKGPSSATDPDGSSADIGLYGGGFAGIRDLDDDGYEDWYWTGSFSTPPNGVSNAAFDCDDQDPLRHACS